MGAAISTSYPIPLKFFTILREVYNFTLNPVPTSSPREPQPMGSQFREP